jgi:hypothetical protein
VTQREPGVRVGERTTISKAHARPLLQTLAKRLRQRVGGRQACADSIDVILPCRFTPTTRGTVSTTRVALSQARPTPCRDYKFNAKPDPRAELRQLLRFPAATRVSPVRCERATTAYARIGRIEFSWCCATPRVALADRDYMRGVRPALRRKPAPAPEAPRTRVFLQGLTASATWSQGSGSKRRMIPRSDVERQHAQGLT